MMPKFQVGEHVIFAAPTSGLAPREVVVVNVEWQSYWNKCSPKGRYGYEVNPNPDAVVGYWAEHCLHKIPPLADQSFSELMADLKQPAPKETTIAN